jgi:hypothetical protein
VSARPCCAAAAAGHAGAACLPGSRGWRRCPSRRPRCPIPKKNLTTQAPAAAAQQLATQAPASSRAPWRRGGSGYAAATRPSAPRHPPPQHAPTSTRTAAARAGGAPPHQRRRRRHRWRPHPPSPPPPPPRRPALGTAAFSAALARGASCCRGHWGTLASVCAAPAAPPSTARSCALPCQTPARRCDAGLSSTTPPLPPGRGCPPWHRHHPLRQLAAPGCPAAKRTPLVAGPRGAHRRRRWPASRRRAGTRSARRPRSAPVGTLPARAAPSPGPGSPTQPQHHRQGGHSAARPADRQRRPSAPQEAPRVAACRWPRGANVHAPPVIATTPATGWYRRQHRLQSVPDGCCCRSLGGSAHGAVVTAACPVTAATVAAARWWCATCWCRAEGKWAGVGAGTGRLRPGYHSLSEDTIPARDEERPTHCRGWPTDQIYYLYSRRGFTTCRVYDYM